MRKSAVMSSEECIAFSKLQPLHEELLGDLKSRTTYLHTSWLTTSAEQKAQRDWCIAIGVLAHDVGSAVLDLIDCDRLRAGKILNRSLLEYRVSLNVYKLDAARALRDATDASKEMRKFFENRPMTIEARPGLSSSDLENLKSFIENNPGKPSGRNFYNDLRFSNQKDYARTQFEYLAFYGYASALAHGGGLILCDSVLPEEDDKTSLEWQSPYLTPYAILLEAFLFLLGILKAIEETSDRFQAHVVIRRKYIEIIKPALQNPGRFTFFDVD